MNILIMLSISSIHHVLFLSFRYFLYLTHSLYQRILIYFHSNSHKFCFNFTLILKLFLCTLILKIFLNPHQKVLVYKTLLFLTLLFFLVFILPQKFCLIKKFILHAHLIFGLLRDRCKWNLFLSRILSLVMLFFLITLLLLLFNLIHVILFPQ